MPYFYTDPTRESDPHALPDVEVFQSAVYRTDCDCQLDVYPSSSELGPQENPSCPSCGQACSLSEVEPAREGISPGYFYAFGSPGCLWDSEPVGPFGTEQEALEAAREAAGIEQ